MLFYRSHQRSHYLTVGAVRTLSTTGLVAYPTGALMLGPGPNAAVTSLVGYTLIFIALVTCVLLSGSSIQRIVGEDAKVLDEFELRLRGRTMVKSYAAFTGLVLLLVAYAAIASDNGAWLPDSFSEFNGVFWGVFLYAFLLPTAVLSWMVDRSFTNEKGGGSGVWRQHDETN